MKGDSNHVVKANVAECLVLSKFKENNIDNIRGEALVMTHRSHQYQYKGRRVDCLLLLQYVESRHFLHRLLPAGPFNATFVIYDLNS
jgi:hypothetical protein